MLFEGVTRSYIPVNNSLRAQVLQCFCQLSCPKPDSLLIEETLPLKVDYMRWSEWVRTRELGNIRTSQISSKHKIKNEKTVLIVLEGIS